jgi:hypothetical protein
MSRKTSSIKIKNIAVTRDDKKAVKLWPKI